MGNPYCRLAIRERPNLEVPDASELIYMLSSTRIRKNLLVDRKKVSTCPTSTSIGCLRKFYDRPSCWQHVAGRTQTMPRSPRSHLLAGKPKLARDGRRV